MPTSPTAAEFTPAQQGIVDVTVELLAASKDHDVAIRDIAMGAGVQPPVIYRHFGGKAELLAVTVEHVYDLYLARKKALPRSNDPLDDLRHGWDTHVEFALNNRGAYHLLFAPSPDLTVPAARKSLDMIERSMTELACAGRMLVPVEQASQMVLSANIGVSFALAALGDTFPDPKMSTLVRDAMHRSVIAVDSTADASAGQQAAITLLADPGDRLSPGETLLFQELLARIAKPTL